MPEPVKKAIRKISTRSFEWLFPGVWGCILALQNSRLLLDIFCIAFEKCTNCYLFLYNFFLEVCTHEKKPRVYACAHIVHNKNSQKSTQKSCYLREEKVPNIFFATCGKKKSLLFATCGKKKSLQKMLTYEKTKSQKKKSYLREEKFTTKCYLREEKILPKNATCGKKKFKNNFTTCGKKKSPNFFAT